MHTTVTLRYSRRPAGNEARGFALLRAAVTLRMAPGTADIIRVADTSKPPPARAARRAAAAGPGSGQDAEDAGAETEVTTFTIRPGTITSRSIAWPAVCSAKLGCPDRTDSISSRSAPVGTVMVNRVRPLT